MNYRLKPHNGGFWVQKRFMFLGFIPLWVSVGDHHMARSTGFFKPRQFESAASALEYLEQSPRLSA